MKLGYFYIGFGILDIIASVVFLSFTIVERQPSYLVGVILAFFVGIKSISKGRERIADVKYEARKNDQKN